MEEFDLHTTYIRTTSGYVPYMGGANFADGKNKCPHCASNMNRTPIRQPFIRLDKGKVLVDTLPNGMMVLNKMEPAWSWDCGNCNLNVTPAKIL